MLPPPSLARAVYEYTAAARSATDAAGMATLSMTLNAACAAHSDGDLDLPAWTAHSAIKGSAFAGHAATANTVAAAMRRRAWLATADVVLVSFSPLELDARSSLEKAGGSAACTSVDSNWPIVPR